MVALFGGGLLVLALLVAFAIALADNQSSSKAALEARVHDRATIAAALVGSIFASVSEQAATDQRQFGDTQVSDAKMQAERGNALYLALVDGDGTVLAHSSGFTNDARSALAKSATLKAVASGTPLLLGDLLPYGKSGVVNLVLGLNTAAGRRELVEGVAPSQLAALFAGELRQIPGPTGSHNLIVDANDTVIASNLASRPTGYRSSQTERAALDKPSGDHNGRYYTEVALADSDWRLVIGEPDSTLFASVNGLHRWVPWLIFVAFAIFGVISLGLGWRVLHSAERDLARANVELATVNLQLETSNHQLARRANELARSNAELDQFASIASHDLQEPLRKVRTFTEQLASTESDRLSERGADYLQRANRAAERMQALIQDLLQYSRVTTNPRPYVQVDLNAVAAEVLDDLSVEIEGTGAEVTVGTLPTLSADPMQMRQLVLNLLSNALKFRREGVTPAVTVTSQLDGESAQIVVADNGIGFEPQYATRIFRVFERLNGRGEYPGTGIGLALCQKIAIRHGGAIVAHGELDTGARFIVTLPLEHVSGSSPTDLPSVEPDPASRTTEPDSASRIAQPEPVSVTADRDSIAKEQAHAST